MHRSPGIARRHGARVLREQAVVFGVSATVGTTDATQPSDMQHRGRALSRIGLLAVVVVPGCGGDARVVARGLERVNDDRFVEHLGENRYTYSITRLSTAPERGAAQLALTPPPGARELAQIEITVPDLRSPINDLRTERAQFFPTIATLAGRLGGSRFVVSHTDRAGAWPWITSLVADVYAPP